jgi:crotonobetainyl-CoA:carnitine CoA-transferase CaiB-like acyl-CoA transferase
MNEPLAGIRVVEMSIAVQGPAAGVYLRDMGAEVIKVEPPLGDPSRYGRGVDNPTPVGTPGPQFVACNRGKRSVCVDLTTEPGMRALHALLAGADVFLTNYRASALERLGLGDEALRGRYPNLIYAMVNGFGPAGPDADKAMLDGAAVARGGLAGMTGARLDPAGGHHPNIRGPYGIYATQCGGAIMLAQTMAEDAWDAFCVFADLPELALDPRWSSPGRRLGEGVTDEDSRAVRALLAEAFARKSADQWEAFLRTQPEIIFERVRRWHDVLDDVQVAANGYAATVDVPDFGATRLVGNLVTMSHTPGSVKGGPPRLGEGNDELLAQAGLAKAEIRSIEVRATQMRETALALLAEAGRPDRETTALDETPQTPDDPTRSVP